MSLTCFPCARTPSTNSAGRESNICSAHVKKTSGAIEVCSSRATWARRASSQRRAYSRRSGEFLKADGECLLALLIAFQFTTLGCLPSDSTTASSNVQKAILHQYGKSASACGRLKKCAASSARARAASASASCCRAVACNSAICSSVIASYSARLRSLGDAGGSSSDFGQGREPARLPNWRDKRKAIWALLTLAIGRSMSIVVRSVLASFDGMPAPLGKCWIA